MAESPASQLLSQVFDEKQLEKYRSFVTYVETGGSIFPLVEKGVRGLVRDFDIDPEDARRFLRRANSMAIYLQREYIEHTLFDDETQDVRPRSGIWSLVKGPSFEQLFPTRFHSLCPPDALESYWSPVAYMIALLRWIKDRIESVGNAEELLPLENRRQDLAKLSVDFNAVHQSVSAVDIIVSVLETYIEKHGTATDLEQALIDARYPNGLPYYQHWVTVDTVARHHDLSVGSFAHKVDNNFPYFLQNRSWDVSAGRALAHASRLGPYQRTLLTESAPTLEDIEDFYRLNFGAFPLPSQNLNQVQFFGERTKLDTPGLEALLSVRGFAPTRSPNVTYSHPVPTDPDVAESEHCGSVYINGNASPTIRITKETGPAFVHRLNLNPLQQTGLDSLDRLNRKVRLDQWLELPSDQVDALLAAAMRADNRADPAQNPWLITDNVVHALGMFQSLRERYGCVAHDFAVFIDELSIYGRGTTSSRFDQAFNSQGDYRQPLLLDAGSFPVLPKQGVPDLTVTQICSGLAIDLKTYAYLAVMIAAALGDTDTLKRDAPTLSSFYRMVKLPRLLGITPVEGALMLALLGGDSWINGLAGIPWINPNDNADAPDALNLIHAMHTCVEWCADCNLPVLWMLQQVSPPQAPATPSENDSELFEQVRNLLSGAMFTNAALLMAGVPVLPGASWLDLLTTVVDADGLVVDPSASQTDYPAFARAALDQAVRDGLGEIDDTLRALIVEKMFVVLMQAREAQVSLVKQTLGVYAGVDANQALLILQWCDATVYKFLSQVYEHGDSVRYFSTKRRDAIPDPLFVLLADLRRRSAVVLKLDLSAELLQDYLNYGHKAWLDQDDKHAFTVRTLYYLTTLVRAFELSEQPAGDLLDYLREVNALPDPLGEDATRIAQQAATIRLARFFQWSVQDVRECVDRAAPDLKILRSLPQLDLLMRVRTLGAKAGMDALTIFLMGTLPVAVNKELYKQAAEHALASLTETIGSVPALTEDLKQLVTMTCVVDNTEVIANKPNATLTFTVTLTDIDGEPLKGVWVYWSAVLGSIAPGKTDPRGVLEAIFTPGKIMGTETPLFWLDLFEPEYAPTIHVIADSKKMTFPGFLKAQVPLEAVPYGEEIELYATLMDSYQNLGINTPVKWEFEARDKALEDRSLTIRPAQTFTNQEGVTRVFVSSPTGGRFLIVVRIAASPSGSEFEYITFEPPEPEDARRL